MFLRRSVINNFESKDLEIRHNFNAHSAIFGLFTLFKRARIQGEIVLTSMDADGTKDGYDLEITAAVSEAVSIPVVASGGAGSPAHLADAIEIGKADAALAASIFHFGTYSIEETKRVMAGRGIPMRI